MYLSLGKFGIGSGRGCRRTHFGVQLDSGTKRLRVQIGSGTSPNHFGAHIESGTSPNHFGAHIESGMSPNHFGERVAEPFGVHIGPGTSPNHFAVPDLFGDVAEPFWGSLVQISSRGHVVEPFGVEIGLGTSPNRFGSRSVRGCRRTDLDSDAPNPSMLSSTCFTGNGPPHFFGGGAFAGGVGRPPHKKVRERP